MRENLKDKKRIVFKVGSSTLTHKETGALDLVKMEKFGRKKGTWQYGKTDRAFGETGLRSGWTVPPDDSVSKTFFGIQSKYRTDFDD